MNEEVASTGADAVTPAAELGSAEVTTDTGAETQTVTAEGQGEVEETTSQEGDIATGGEENPDKGAHQKTLEQRAEEIAERKIREFEQKLQAQMERKAPDFDPPEAEAMVQKNIVAATVRMRSIESELELSGDDADPALIQEHWRLKRWIAQAETALDENQRRRMAWEEREAGTAKMQAQIAAVNAQIVEASPIVAQGLGISKESWDAGEKWFIEQRKANPMLDAEYRERCLREGAVRGLRWAAEYVQKEMGKKSEAARQQKEEGKDKSIGGSSDTVQDFANVKNWTDLMKLPSKDINRFSKDHPKRFAEIKRRHFR